MTDEFLESFPVYRKVLSLIASKEEKVAAFLQLFSENRKIFTFLPKSAKIHAESEHTESGLQKNVHFSVNNVRIDIKSAI